MSVVCSAVSMIHCTCYCIENGVQILQSHLIVMYHYVQLESNSKLVLSTLSYGFLRKNCMSNYSSVQIDWIQSLQWGSCCDKKWTGGVDCTQKLLLSLLLVQTRYISFSNYQVLFVVHKSQGKARFESRINATDPSPLANELFEEQVHFNQSNHGKFRCDCVWARGCRWVLLMRVEGDRVSQHC